MSSPNRRAVVGRARARCPRSPDPSATSMSYSSASASPASPSSTTPSPSSSGTVVGAARDRRPRSLATSPPNSLSISTGIPAVAVVPQNTHVFLKSFVHGHKLANRPDNTKKAINPKVREWVTFCNYVYGEIAEETRYTLNSDNTYKFMLYQAMRPKKSQGGKKRARVEVDEEEEEAAEEDAVFFGVGSQGGVELVNSVPSRTMPSWTNSPTVACRHLEMLMICHSLLTLLGSPK
jgi:hypothetical protein